MNLKCKHLSYNVADINAMREFYVNKLGLELLDNGENFFAVRSGDVRFSFFAGAKKHIPPDDGAGMGVIFQTGNIIDTRDEILKHDITLLNDIVTAPGFMKFITFEDPDGNIVHIGEYLADPFHKKV